MLTNSIKASIEDYLSKAKRKKDTEKMEICEWIYKTIILKNPQCQDDIVAYFFENADYIETNSSQNSNNAFTSREISELERKYGTQVDSIFEQLLKENLSPNEFYNKLWNHIATDETLNSEKAKIFALYYIWIDVRIPYFQVKKGLNISSDECKKIANKIEKCIAKSRFILSTNYYTNRAERLSCFLDLFKEYSLQKKEQTVLLLYVINFLLDQNNSKNENLRIEQINELINRIDEKIAQLESVGS